MSKPFRSSQPTVEQAARGDFHAMRLTLESYANRLAALEESTGNIAFNQDSQTPRNPAPPPAKLTVAKASPGWLSVRIANPQYIGSGIPGKKSGNLLRATMWHRVRYTTDPTFKTGVEELPPSTQTHFHVPTNGQRIYIQHDSAVDGHNYNSKQQTRGHSA